MDLEPPNLESLQHLYILALSGYGLALGIFLLILLLISSALISGSEIAFFSLSPSENNDLAEEESSVSKQIIELKSKPRTLLATILICNNLINIGIVVLSDILLKQIIPQDIFDQWAKWLIDHLGLTMISVSSLSGALSFLITVGLVTFILVLFGEVIPKIYASINNLNFAKMMARPLTFLSKTFGPISAVLVKWTQEIEDKVEQDHNHSTNPNDIDAAIDLAVTHDDSHEGELDILKGIVKFNQFAVKQIMKSRVDVTAIELSIDFKELMKIIKETGYSRIPVYSDDFDNITGILYVKDLLGHTNEDSEFEWQKFIRTDTLYIPESKKINFLLKEFQQKRVHMAIVVDEYGGSSGIVTLEDIMEEVIGDIKDEFDMEEEVDYEKIDDLNYIFEGKTMLNDVCRIIGENTNIFDESRGEADSLAGLILEIVGYIPAKGKEILVGSFKFRVVKANKKRIERVKITIIEN